MPEGERKPAERLLYARSAARVLPWAAAALFGTTAFALFTAFYTGVAAIYLWLARSLNAAAPKARAVTSVHSFR